jgi:hypothetical protein
VNEDTKMPERVWIAARLTDAKLYCEVSRSRAAIEARGHDAAEYVSADLYDLAEQRVLRAEERADGSDRRAARLAKVIHEADCRCGGLGAAIRADFGALAADPSPQEDKPR